jgi:hypothetical protein
MIVSAVRAHNKAHPVLDQAAKHLEVLVNMKKEVRKISIRIATIKSQYEFFCYPW